MTSATIAARRPRLMIADDDPLVVSMLGTSLGHQFELVGVASDGEQAIELARASQPNVALVDVEMPRGGGLGAVRGILGVAPDTAIVVLSGDESDEVVRELMRAGAMTYRRKGIPTQVLAECLIESINAHNMERMGDPRGASMGPGGPVVLDSTAATDQTNQVDRVSAVTTPVEQRAGVATTAQAGRARARPEVKVVGTKTRAVDPRERLDGDDEDPVKDAAAKGDSERPRGARSTPMTSWFG